MESSSASQVPLLEHLFKIIDDNLNNEQFGVEDLARELGMSRTQLHRKLHQINGKSASQVIREYRLQKAKEFLENEDLTAAEVAYKVGFGSPSYFNTCFNEFYGYPPGEAIFRKPKEGKRKGLTPKKVIILASGIFLLSLVFILIWQYNEWPTKEQLLPRTDKGNDKSIAVLPLKNIGDSDENLLLCDGMMEEIINHLHRISDLNVRDRTSLEQYRNTKKSIEEIAEELGVANILEGSARMHNERFRIAAKLIQVKTGYLLWSDEFEGTLSDTIFIVQSRIAKEIALKLDATISPAEKQQIEKFPASSYAAYQKYMEGRQSLMEFWRFHDSTDLEMTEQYFRESLEIDANFAMGYSGLADVFAQKNMYDSVLYYANKSLELDPDNAWEYMHKAWYYQNYKRDPKRALEAYKKAIELDPKFPPHYTGIGMFYCEELQDYVTGFTYLKKAENLHFEQRSNSATLYCWWARLYMHIGEYEQAEQLFKKSITTDPRCNNMLHYSWLIGIKTGWEAARIYADSAICNIQTCDNYCNSVKYFSSFNLKEFERALTLYNTSKAIYFDGIPHKNVVVTPQSFDSLFIAFMYQKENRFDETKIILNNSLRRLKKQKASSWYVSMKYAILYAIMDDRKKMYKHLSQAVKLGLRYGWHDYIERCPVFEDYWDDPEFKTIILRLKKKNEQIIAKLDSLKEEGIAPLLNSEQ